MSDKSKIKCPLCGEGTLEDKILDYRTNLKEGGHYKKIVIEDLPAEVCSNCKEVILPKESLEKVYAERHKISHLLTAVELKNLRKSLKLSQSEMSELLGVGKKSYLRWEKGSCLQSKSIDRYIRLLASNPDNIDFLRKLDGAGK